MKGPWQLYVGKHSKLYAGYNLYPGVASVIDSTSVL